MPEMGWQAMCSSWEQLVVLEFGLLDEEAAPFPPGGTVDFETEADKVRALCGGSGSVPVLKGTCPCPCPAACIWVCVRCGLVLTLLGSGGTTSTRSAAITGIPASMSCCCCSTFFILFLLLLDFLGLVDMML